jgi:hypothetical protein
LTVVPYRFPSASSTNLAPRVFAVSPSPIPDKWDSFCRVCGLKIEPAGRNLDHPLLTHIDHSGYQPQPPTVTPSYAEILGRIKDLEARRSGMSDAEYRQAKARIQADAGSSETKVPLGKQPLPVSDQKSESKQSAFQGLAT